MPLAHAGGLFKGEIMGYNPPLISGPIAPESNPPINPQYYQPGVFYISAIFRDVFTAVTTVGNHNYVVGQLVRLVIPMIYGAFQLNEREGYVTAIPLPDQVLINIDSTNADPFVANPMSGTTQPQIVAVGDVNTGQINASGKISQKTYIPGSFVDISPL
jgi:hypothetical protein